MSDTPTPRLQIDEFRELETDNDEAAFDARLKKLAGAKPKAPRKPAK